jgi:hypothetical protein
VLIAPCSQFSHDRLHSNHDRFRIEAATYLEARIHKLCTSSWPVNYVEEYSERENKNQGQVQQKPPIETVDQVTAVRLSTSDLSNQQRGRLLGVLFWSGDLIQEEQKNS